MKYTRYLGFFAVMTLFFAIAASAKATEALPQAASLQVAASAGVPVILPTNPFYFAKELVRDVRWFFTFGKVKKAAYELQIANEKALEVKEIQKISPKNIDAIKKALDNYQSDVTSVTSKIESIQNSSDDPRVTDLVDTLSDQAVRTTALLQDLKADDSIKVSVEETESAVTAAVTSVIETPDSLELIQATDENPLIDTDIKMTIETAPVKSELLQMVPVIKK